MALDFPANPTNGQTFGNYIYDTTIPGWRNVNSGEGVGLQFKSGLIPVVPTSIAVASGAGSVSSDGTITFAACTSVSINGCFSAAYANYRVIFNNYSASVYESGGLRMRSAGTDNTTAYYRNGMAIDAAASSTFSVDAYSYYPNILSTHPAGANGHAASVIEIMQPFIARPSTFMTTSQAWTGAQNRTIITTGFHTTVSSFDGVTFFMPSGTFGGTFKIYGYN